VRMEAGQFRGWEAVSKGDIDQREGGSVRFGSRISTRRQIGTKKTRRDAGV
jgi:hypothetical protein